MEDSRLRGNDDNFLVFAHFDSAPKAPTFGAKVSAGLKDPTVGWCLKRLLALKARLLALNAPTVGWLSNDN